MSPGLRQTVKTLFAVRWNLIVQRRRFIARCSPAGEAEAGKRERNPPRIASPKLIRSMSEDAALSDCALIEWIDFVMLQKTHKEGAA